MPVTELAILRLPHGRPMSTVFEDLDEAKAAMEYCSGHPFYYFQCLEDPHVIYILGAWPSVDFHMTEWIPSAQNQELLKVLQGRLTVDTMFHIDIDRTVTPIPARCKVLGVARRWVATDQRDGFTRAFEQERRWLDEVVGSENVVGGWRIDGQDVGVQEFVLFTGWESREMYLEFVDTKEFREFNKIGEFVSKDDVKHATLLDAASVAKNWWRQSSGTCAVPGCT